MGGLGNGSWRRALWVVQHQAALLGEGQGEGGRGLQVDAGEGAFGVVVRPPDRKRGARKVQGREQVSLTCSSRILPLKLSTKLFCMDFAGAM